MIQSAQSVRRVVLGFFLGFGILVAFDVLVFRLGFYDPYLLPFSSAGMFHMILQGEKTRPFDNPNQVLALGDSRMALRAVIANKMKSGLTYGFAGVAGTLPRCWYYFLREVDPGRNRYSAILLPVDEYSDEDWEDLDGRSTDLRFLSTVLGLRDLRQFAGSFPTWDGRLQAAMGVLFKGVTYKDDFKEFLIDPAKRKSEVVEQNAQWIGALQDEGGDKRDMRGLSIDWTTLRATYPERLNAEERRVVNDFLLHRSAQYSGKRAGYHRKWFGRILEQYRASRTKLIFYRLPRGALVRPDSILQKKSFTIPSFRGQPNVIVLDEHLLDELEKPEYFMDAVHLNGEGRKLLTKILAGKVREVLAQ